MHNKITNHIRR